MGIMDGVVFFFWFILLCYDCHKIGFFVLVSISIFILCLCTIVRVIDTCYDKESGMKVYTDNNNLPKVHCFPPC